MAISSLGVLIVDPLPMTFHVGLLDTTIIS